MIFFFLSQILLTGKAGKVTAAGVVSGMETGMEQLCCVSEDLKTINECSVSILLCCHGSPAFSRGSFREQLGLGKSSGGNEPPLLKLLSQCLISPEHRVRGCSWEGVQHLTQTARFRGSNNGIAQLDSSFTCFLIVLSKLY